MKKIFILFLVFLCPLLHAVQYPTVADLITDPDTYDQQAIVVRGEVIGDVFGRNGTVWINIRQGDYSIGVHAQESILPQITFTGSHTTRGDAVSIAGVFNKMSTEHGGDMMIVAREVYVVEQGETIDHVSDKRKVQLIRILLVLFLFSLFLVGYQAFGAEKE
ncbi:hypothetical protein ACFL56_02805 [Candidatus Margulisiibacteriota bacterium]